MNNERSVFEIGEFRLCVKLNEDVTGTWDWSISCCKRPLKSGYSETRELAIKACDRAFRKLYKPLLEAAKEAE